MTLKDQPIQRQLRTVILLTTTAVLLLTCTAFLFFEWATFRRDMAQNLSTLAEITAINSTAVLEFENQEDAREVLSALRGERHIVAAALYNAKGQLFARYPAIEPPSSFPPAPQPQGHRFARRHLSLFYPVIENEKRLGTLYLKSDLSAMYAKFRLYAAIALLSTLWSASPVLTLVRAAQLLVVSGVAIAAVRGQRSLPVADVGEHFLDHTANQFIGDLHGAIPDSY